MKFYPVDDNAPGRAVDGEPFRRRIVPLLCFIVFFSVLNGTMFNVAVPDIAAEFSLSPAEVSWVMSGYIVVFALASAVYGKLADLYPVRRLVTVGLLLFSAGAALGFLARWYPLLIGARLLQAAGGGAIPAMGMLVATRYFPPDSRGRVMGALASTVAFGAGVGPVVGGVLAGSLHWRYLFLLSFATLIAIPLFRKLLPRESSLPGRFDVPGALLLGASVALFLIFVTHRALWALPAAGVAGGALVVRLRRAAEPFVRPGLFLNTLYRSGLVTVFLGVSTVFGMIFLTPLLLRMVYGLDTRSIGMVIFPGAMSAAVLGNVAGRLADRIGGPAIVRAGLASLIGTYLLLSAFAGAGPIAVALCMVFGYAGLSFIQASLAKTVSMTLLSREIGIGMGVYNLVFFASGAFGAAFSAALLDAFPYLFPQMAMLDVFRWVFVLAAFGAVLSLTVFVWNFKGFGSEGQ